MSGWGANGALVADQLRQKDYAFVLIQETKHITGSPRLSDPTQNFRHFEVSGYDPNIDSTAKGGIVTYVNNAITAKTVLVAKCADYLATCTGLLLIINVYLPNRGLASSGRYQEAIDEIIALVIDKQETHGIIIAGDFNTSENSTNLRHFNRLKEYLELSDWTEHIPSTTKHKETLPGYREHVEPAQKEYAEAYNEWVNSGKQKEGEKYDRKNECKDKRDAAFEERKRHEDQIKADKIAGDYAKGGNSQCWAPIRKAIKGNNQKSSAIIGGLNKPEEIGNFWREHYKKKLKGTDKPVLKDSEAYQEFLKLPSSYIKFTEEQALEALYQLNPEKACYDLYTPKMLRLIDREFAPWFARMMEIFVNSPSEKQKKFLQEDNFLKTYITPIPKGHGLDITDASSYRPISVSHTLANYADRLIKLHPAYEIKPPKNFFGYVKGRGTDFALKTMKNLIKQTANPDEAKLIFLDARSAFESLIWDIVFPRLAGKIGTTLTRTVWLMYRFNRYEVRWNGVTYGEPFYAGQGTKQGGSLSSDVFLEYMTILNFMLSNIKGIEFNGQFWNNLMYADDVALACENNKVAQECLNVCQLFQDEGYLRWNADKTVVLEVTTSKKADTRKNTGLFLNGQELEGKEKGKYLGYMVNRHE